MKIKFLLFCSLTLLSGSLQIDVNEANEANEDLDTILQEILQEILHLPSPPVLDWINFDQMDQEQKVENNVRRSERIRHFSCPECNRNFVRKEYLERHLVSRHDLIKPFQCNICHRCSTRRDNTRQHIKNKHSSVIAPLIENLSPAEKVKFLNTECITTLRSR